ncbi:hypothetical protein [Herbaspirillum sp. NPDC101396]|uniref:hypothetical protein n=1 Tax=Herbaspirillum sp. NPDC101396 TaxID=3364005 RepID=UPI00383BB0E0
MSTELKAWKAEENGGKTPRTGSNPLLREQAAILPDQLVSKKQERGPAKRAGRAFSLIILITGMSSFHGIKQAGDNLSHLGYG